MQRFDEGNCHVARTKQKNICESYNLPKASGQVEFMDTYVDRITGKLVVSIAAPYHNAAAHIEGQFVKIFSWIFSGKRSRSSNSKEKELGISSIMREIS